MPDFSGLQSPFQSTRPVKGATRCSNIHPRHRLVSIHAPREGRDRPITSRRIGPAGFQSTRPVKGATLSARKLVARAGVSIHAPREGRDTNSFFGVRVTTPFQSTRPVKGATLAESHAAHGFGVSIHAPREGRDLLGRRRDGGCGVSIHAPREGRDLSAEETRAYRVKFQSTRPVKGATRRRRPAPPAARCFNPRAP